MILATKSGWLISVKVIRETPKGYVIRDCEKGARERRISKSDLSRKLFESTDEALEWMEE
jgi:hypothetical protein